MPPVSVLIKPASSACNMNCRYCFYQDVADKRACGFAGMMALETAEALVSAAMEYAEGSCSFLFQGGEPTLAGLDFYRSFLQLERKYAKPGVAVQNSIQTNGYLIDDAWAAFLHDNRFLTGLSLDGPAEYHDSNRLDRGGKGLLNYHTEKFGDVAAIKVVDMDDDVILISEDGVIIRIAASSIRVCARPSKGVRVMKLAEGSKVVTLARVPHEEDEVDQVDIEDDGTADEGGDTPDLPEEESEDMPQETEE